MSAEHRTMSAHQAVIVGAGPTGLMLAGELALAGVDVGIVERRPNQDVPQTRARGFHSRTLEVLDQRGIVDRFLAEGKPAQIVGFAWIRLDMSDVPTRYPYGLALEQNAVERILAGWVEELGVPIERGVQVTGFSQDDSEVSIALSDGRAMTANYLVGCDGGRSLVRKMAGIDFPGSDPTVSNLIAEVQMTDEPELGLRRDMHGVHGLNRLEDGRTVGVLVTEPEVGQTDEPDLHDLSKALIAAYGSDFGAHSPNWISRFTDTARQAASYRKGRVLLAGDAAHIHYPTGGQGLSVGVQDAVNLGWKLAQVVRGVSPESLLDTYQAERHSVAARVLSNSRAQVALLRTDEQTNALREAVAELLKMDEPRKSIAATMSALDIHYDLGEGHPLLGRRVPDLDLIVGGESVRLFSLLHEARPVLLNLDRPGGLDAAEWSGRVRTVVAGYRGAWELPVIRIVSAPTAVLIRPDGYVAWVGEGSSDGLGDALARWFGPPTAA
jgi:3-(3-hydroxy-phenyl)propionate hydroxylase